METTVNANVVLRNNNVSGTVVTGGSNTGTATASILVATPRAVASTRRNVYNANASANESALHATVTERWIFNHNELHNLGYDESGHTGFQRSLIEGVGIEIVHGINGDTINCTVNGAEWGNISGDIENQLDLIAMFSGKQDVLTAGTGITIDQDNVVSNNVSPLVPAQATINNQLADKDFVNSSIATSTASYRGANNQVIDLGLSVSATFVQVATALNSIITTADNNDYCFVQVPTSDSTPAEIQRVDRYKYATNTWVYEYTLNNSGYTAAQWKAINSGITSGKVTQYDDYATSKQDTLIAGTNITIGADGKTISSDIPQATSQLAGKVLLGVAGGAATYESVENRLPICYPTTASDVTTSSMLVKSSVDGNGRMLTENGFVYNTSGNPTVSDNKVICDLGAGFFEKKLENLTHDTEYHIKSYGQNSSGISYGSELVQSTLLTSIPAEYQLVEYLICNGNQYIDPNIFGTDKMILEFKNVLFEQLSTGYSALYGTYIGSAGNSNFIQARYSLQDIQFRYNSSNGIEFGISYSAINIKIDIDATINVYINNNIVGTLTRQSVNYNRIDIFRINYLNSNNFHGRCGDIIINDGTYDVRHLYPVYRKLDQVAGMYDIVNNVFYTNQGTGTFTVGPDKQWGE